MASSTISAEDMRFHALYIGSTGAGKTNALLYWLLRLFGRKDVALALIDPHVDAAFDLVRTIPESERGRVALIDPEFVTFGLNPLSLPEGMQITNRVQVMQTQVEELSALLSDVLNTDASTAPRLMWIFKGALYYLYSISDGPTFRDLYHILVDFISLPKETIEQMLHSRRINEEIIRSTIDAISKLQKDAFASVINRIANFVLPPQSITLRTFCARISKLDFSEMTTPGRLTIFRITKSLPYDFRRLISASIVMRFYFEVEKRAARLERAGEPPSARTPIILAIDEFQNISDLKLLDTILSESRKFGLYLWMVNQNIQQIRQELHNAIGGNVGPVFCFRVGAKNRLRGGEHLLPCSRSPLELPLSAFELLLQALKGFVRQVGQQHCRQGRAAREPDGAHPVGRARRCGTRGDPVAHDRKGCRSCCAREDVQEELYDQRDRQRDQEDDYPLAGLSEG
ncbi:MAG: ATP-binding protein [Nitrososphaerota archaeon]|nr:ATP-binding protein [Nitrososphaerota archaeon]